MLHHNSLIMMIIVSHHPFPVIDTLHNRKSEYIIIGTYYSFINSSISLYTTQWVPMEGPGTHHWSCHIFGVTVKASAAVKNRGADHSSWRVRGRRLTHRHMQLPRRSRTLPLRPIPPPIRACTQRPPPPPPQLTKQYCCCQFLTFTIPPPDRRLVS